MTTFLPILSHGGNILEVPLPNFVAHCRFGGKEPEWECKKLIFSDINYTPQSGMRLEIPQQFLCSFRRLSFQENLVKAL